MGLSYEFFKEGRVAAGRNIWIRKMMKIGLVGLLFLAGAISLAAAAQGTKKEAYAAKKADCAERADAKDFGMHFYQRDRFVVRCIAGLSH